MMKFLPYTRLNSLKSVKPKRQTTSTSFFNMINSKIIITTVHNYFLFLN